jgi:hypothetical protein
VSLSSDAGQTTIAVRPSRVSETKPLWFSETVRLMPRFTEELAAGRPAVWLSASRRLRWTRPSGRFGGRRSRPDLGARNRPEERYADPLSPP